MWFMCTSWFFTPYFKVNRVYTLFNFEISRCVTSDRTRHKTIQRAVLARFHILHARLKETRNTQSTAWDITCNLEVGQRVVYSRQLHIRTSFLCYPKFKRFYWAKSRDDRIRTHLNHAQHLREHFVTASYTLSNFEISTWCHLVDFELHPRVLPRFHILTTRAFYGDSLYTQWQHV